MAKRVGNFIVETAARMYQRSMRRKLNAYGLKYDDLLIEEDPAIGEAIKRLTPEQQLARTRRLFRAMDISLKKVPLPDHMQAVQKPFEFYLQDTIKQVEDERRERELLNGR